MKSLAKVIGENTATLFGEKHDNDAISRFKLIDKYSTIFEAAREAGVVDVMIERRPSIQNDINETINVYKDHLESGGDPKDLMRILKEPDTDSQHAQIILAALYDIKLHAVDIGDRSEIDVFRYAVDQYREYTKENPDAAPSQFLGSLNETQMDAFRARAGRDIQPEEVNEIVRRIANEGMENELNQRVINGDKKIANLMMDKAEGRPFIAIFGKAHGSLIDEHKEGFQKVDMEGALRLIMGEDSVAHVTLANDYKETMQDVADYVLFDDMSLRETYFEEGKISDELRQDACNLHQLPCDLSK